MSGDVCNRKVILQKQGNEQQKRDCDPEKNGLSRRASQVHELLSVRLCAPERKNPQKQRGEQGKQQGHLSKFSDHNDGPF